MQQNKCFLQLFYFIAAFHMSARKFCNMCRAYANFPGWI